ncbi:hypothetical protein Y695_04101 [Hydrogenophaga sp. T4]|nr:hypothetical protein Y695_04101 [Hydrogenophaga sp. T4]
MPSLGSAMMVMMTRNTRGVSTANTLDHFWRLWSTLAISRRRSWPVTGCSSRLVPLAISTLCDEPSCSYSEPPCCPSACQFSSKTGLATLNVLRWKTNTRVSATRPVITDSTSARSATSAATALAALALMPGATPIT